MTDTLAHFHCVPPKNGTLSANLTSVALCHTSVSSEVPTLDKDTARARFQHGYNEVSDCPLREAKAAREGVRTGEDGILSYFLNRAAKAPAEPFNSKIKSFRAQQRGVADLPFFMPRPCTVFGQPPTELCRCAGLNHH